MTTMFRHPGYRQTLIALALLAAFGPAAAEDATVESTISIGAGALSGSKADRATFGQYNGLRTHGAHGLLDFDYYRRDDGTGTLTRFQGYNVLGETRELGFLWKRQGEWKFAAEYGELVRYEPYTVNTALAGAGTTTPQVVHLPGGPGTGSDLDLKTRRTGLGLTFANWISPALQFEASVRSENKDGSRLFGRGMSCPSPVAPGCAFTTGMNPGWAVLFLPEPVNSNHTQFDARLSYAADKLRLSGGYYGSFYNNSNGAMTPTIPGSLNSPLGTLQPLGAGLQPLLSQTMALWPDNQAHHFDLAGNYVFTQTTRANFKVGYARASQNQDFASAGLTGAPAGVSNLGAQVDTKLAQFGITSRPMPKLSLIGEVRYEDRDDKTPLAAYNVEDKSTYTNHGLSRTRVRGKLEASYQFNSDYRGTVGADHESIDRGVLAATGAISGVSALRQKTEEVGYRAELRRRMSEDFSAAVSLVTSRRDGSNWLRDNSGTGVTEITNPAVDLVTGSLFMPTLADRRRDKVRLLANWQPLEGLMLQFSVDSGKDRYATLGDFGLASTRMGLYALDWDYALSEQWSLNGYLSRGNQKLNQSRSGGYILAYDNTSTHFGLGATGKPSSKLEVGGGLSFIDERNVYAQGVDPRAGGGAQELLAATGGLPDIVFRRTEARLFGAYKVSAADTVRLDLIHQRARLNDWSYGYNGVPFVYSDNTTLTQLQSQSVTFLGVRYIHKLR